MAKKNSYEKKAHRKHMLNGTEASAAKGEQSKTVTAITDVVAGVVGMATGAIIGRGSFFAGLAVIGGASYFRSRAAGAFGVGLMATGGYQLASLHGNVSGIDGVKERLKAFKDDLKHRLFLDKIIKSKKPAEQTGEEGTNGMGEVQYFNYPNKELEGGPLNFSALDQIERQIAMSAEKHAAKNGISGHSDEDMGAIEEHIL
jgi:hypothetical protein